VFVFTGLWFEYYCLAALAKYRAGAQAAIIMADRDGGQAIHQLTDTSGT